jgi:uncharacterized RDD family membrane protein YckC
MNTRQDIVYAGFLQRLAAFLLDKLMLSALVLLILSTIFYIKPSAVTYLLQTDEAINLPAFLQMYNTDKNSEHELIEILVVAVLTVFFWCRYLATPGKMLMNCQVVDARTLKPVSILQGFLRFAGYFISFISLGIGFLWILGHPRKQGFHDLLAKTIVIQNGDDLSARSLQQLAGELR